MDEIQLQNEIDSLQTRIYFHQNSISICGIEIKKRKADLNSLKKKRKVELQILTGNQRIIKKIEREKYINSLIKRLNGIPNLSLSEIQIVNCIRTRTIIKQSVWYIFKYEFGLKHDELETIFVRDRSTIISGIKTVQNTIDTNNTQFCDLSKTVFDAFGLPFPKPSYSKI